MIEELEKVIGALRDELQQYGELIALLEQQQDQILQRAADGVMKTVASINEQSSFVQQSRQRRRDAMLKLGRTLDAADDTSFADLLPLVPEDYRALMRTLVTENNKALNRIHQRARQNHLLLCRSVELMQTFLNSLLSVTRTETYNDKGNISAMSVAGHSFYDAVG